MGKLWLTAVHGRVYERATYGGSSKLWRDTYTVTVANICWRLQTQRKQQWERLLGPTTWSSIVENPGVWSSKRWPFFHCVLPLLFILPIKRGISKAEENTYSTMENEWPYVHPFWTFMLPWHWIIQRDPSTFLFVY